MVNSEFLESGFRTLIYTTAGILLSVYIFVNVTPFWENVPQVSVVILTMALFSGLTLYFIPKNILKAQLLWLLGCFLMILGVLSFTDNPDLAYLFFILPIMAATMMGWFYGLVITGVLLILLWMGPHFSAFPQLPDSLGLILLIIGLIGVLLTSSYFYSLQTFYQWVFGYYKLARDEIDKTQEQRVVFLEIQEDLEMANRELKRLTDQLDVLYQRAEEARKAKEEFVANVSHELRTPLNMIIGFSDVIMKNPQLYGSDIPNALLADIASIHRNSQHLSRLVDDVLDLSQVEAQRMAITKEWTSIGDIVNEAIGAVHALYDSKSLYLEDEVSPDCPPVFCDSTRLRQVIINLLSNAGRYTEVGGVALKAWPEEESVMLSVKDTGHGISKDDQENIFQPFQQLGDASQRKGGSGLGLSISKKFVEMHDGEMWLESEVGIGTTFCVRIPVNTVLSRNGKKSLDWDRFFKIETQYEPRTREMKISPPVFKPRYLLVEEGNTLKRLLERYMDEVDVISKKDFGDALGEAGRIPVRAIILNTPESIDDLSVEHGLDKLPLGTPIFSCWVPGKDEVARQLGVVNYLLKPVTQEDLVSAIRDLGEGIRRILLVDDETELLQLFARMLSAANPDYQIMQAFDGKRALNLLRSRQPDVVLLDLIMPGIDGFQILREKRTDEAIRHIPVIVVSSINPTGETIISNNLTISRKEGLSVHDLIGCIQSANQILSGSQRSFAD